MALTTNLLAYWKLDESSGNAADATGNGNTLTNTSASYGTGKINNGINYFTTTGSDGLSGANMSSLITGGSFSFAFWGKGASSGSVIRVGFYSTQRAYINYPVNGDNNTIIESRIQGADGTLVNLQPAPPSLGSFHHFVCVYTSSTTWAVYVDGNSTPYTSGGAGNALTNTTIPFTISCSTDVGSNASVVDEVGLWNRALTTAEIAQLYNGGSGLAYPFSSPPVAVNQRFVMQAVKRASTY